MGEELVLGAVALNQLPLDWTGNTARILAAVRDAESEGVQLLCLPELCISGYGCEDAFFSKETRKRSLECLSKVASASSNTIIALGLPLEVKGKLYNATALCLNGRIYGFVLKQFLANYGLHYESRWFKPWQAGRQVQFEFEGIKIPAGDILFCLGQRVLLGIEICQDAWVKDRPAKKFKSLGVGLVFNPSASHFAFGRGEERREAVKKWSKELDSVYVYANLLGNEAGRVIYEGNTLIASKGRLIAEGARFSYRDHLLTCMSAQVKSIAADKTDSFIHLELPNSTSGSQQKFAVYQDSKLKSASRNEEFSRAVALGLFDYMRKSHSLGFVVSLSGGVDSAASAVLVRLMVEFGVQELGVEEFVQRLGVKSLKIPEGSGDRRIGEIVTELLTTVYQSTENSSKITKRAAKEVANSLGARHFELDVSSLVNDYVHRVEDVLGKKLSWEQDDLALQNIQARVRSPGVWLIANIQRKLLLSTSNRSEAAVGYATMDGDTSGGLAPIAGVGKPFLRSWLSWMENVGPEGIAGISALRLVNVQQPTAELRPKSFQQNDEKDLMPYVVLDEIEDLAIRQKLPPLKILDSLKTTHVDESLERLALWVIRFFTLWSQNQWKRERLAPSFHLDDKNLDPKTWCRFPILSAGYKEEIEQIKGLLKNNNVRVEKN